MGNDTNAVPREPAPAPAPQADNPAVPRPKREVAIAVALLGCIALVAFWEFMANRSRRPFEPFALTAQSFANFEPRPAGWSIRSLPVAPDPVEPNILALVVQSRSSPAAPVLVRLVHGYNMVDCMRIKGEVVELMKDTRAAAVVGSRLSAGAGQAARQSNLGTPNAESGTPTIDNRQPTTALVYQLWRLKTSTERVSISATTMLRAGDFSVTDVDTRSMAFPRVDIPDNPGWFPQGVTWRSLRNPIANGRLFLRAKWNSSRADPLTFLGLRQPAWASEELLTLVSSSTDASVSPDQEQAAAQRVLAAQQLVLDELQAWSARQEE